MKDNYQYEAKYYDAQQQKYMNLVLDSKIDFVLWAAQKYLKKEPEELLELGCGTGFSGIALAKKGYKIHGVDIAPKMLAVYKEKIKKLRIKDKITLKEGDICKIELKKKFSVAFALFNEFYEIERKEDVQSALKNVYEHLEENGILVIWLEDFKTRKSLKKGYHTWVGFYEKDGIKIQRTIDEEIQDDVLHWESFSIVDDKGKMSTIYTKTNYPQWGYKNLNNFFKIAGFKKIDCYSNLKEKTKYKLGDRFMIFVAQKN